MPLPSSAHVFCRVIDNFGDIGVCWRLARQLHAEHGLEVSLWVDELASFRRLCPTIDPTRGRQSVSGITVRHWTDEACTWENEPIADLVIEAFACDLPLAYVQAMARRERKPVWINLEYLSAEAWVEGCHTLPSPHPSLPLRKHFFFPGFTAATGGLLLEKDLLAQRDAYQNDAKAKQAFLAKLGCIPPGQASLISLFCYPTAPALSLFAELAREKAPVICLVPEGVASEQVERFLRQPARAGASATQGQLTVSVIPFLAQADYDKLLWSCDLNLVRGEDSAVRAQWAGRPFIWQIYPQQEDAHWPKLDAFLARYAQGLPPQADDVLSATWHAWNGEPGQALPWPAFRDCLPTLRTHTAQWGEHLRGNGDLVSNLLRFAGKIG